MPAIRCELGHTRRDRDTSNQRSSVEDEMEPVVNTKQGKVRGLDPRRAPSPSSGSPTRLRQSARADSRRRNRRSAGRGPVTASPRAPRRSSRDQEFTLIPEPTVDGGQLPQPQRVHPRSRRSGLPVLVWIHGGGFFAGCNASPWYRGEHFARDGVVLVSINYRLGVEGFLSVEDGGANRGVLDWLAALEWVQHNIEAFGGDPSNGDGGRTVRRRCGRRAPSSMPRAQGLLQRAICMSGPVTLMGAAEQAHETARATADDLGMRLTRQNLSEVPIARLLEAPSAPHAARTRWHARPPGV